jgi:hypothetical protein
MKEMEIEKFTYAEECHRLRTALEEQVKNPHMSAEDF